MRTISATVGPLATASATSIAASQSGTANTALTLTSSPYTLDFPRRIIVTSAGDDSSHTFTIVGADWNGTPVVESLTGANGIAQSKYDYTTIVSITPAQNTTSTVTVGTNTVASTRPIFLDPWVLSSVALQVDVSGTVNATVQQTLDNPNDPTNPVAYTSINWINHADVSLVALTSNVQGNYSYAPVLVRLLLNTGSGSATIKLTQYGSQQGDR